MANSNPDMSGLRRTGRPKGSRNKATVAREVAAKAAMVEISKGMSAPEIANLDPVELMLLAMRSFTASGNLDAAISVAAMVAPYTNARKSPTGEGEQAIPADLLPDPVTQSDEPGPLNPVL